MWESCFEGSKYYWQQTFIFKVGNMSFAFQKTERSGEPQ